MKELTNALKTAVKGFAIWCLLVGINAITGEPEGSDGIKILVNLIVAVGIVNRNKSIRNISLITAALTTGITLLPIPTVVEVLLLVGIMVLFFVVLKHMPENNQYSEYAEPAQPTEVFMPAEWTSTSIFHMFEKYTFCREKGITITRGILRRSIVTIPTHTITLNIEQSVSKRVLGLCDVFFQDTYTGKPFGTAYLKNVKFREAMQLKQML